MIPRYNAIIFTTAVVALLTNHWVAAAEDNTDTTPPAASVVASWQPDPVAFKKLYAQAKSTPVIITNTLPINRICEVVSVPWAVIAAKLPGLTPDHVAVRDTASDTLMPVQIFDATGDGKPDELLFLATIPATSTGTYEVLQLADPLPTAFPNRLQARFVPERKDDFAWENDRLAYRTYGPALAVEGSRGGIDIWCKRVREPVIDNWYKHDNYHKDEGTGCDCYKVGASVGCGGTAYLAADQTVSVSPIYATWKLIARGPLRLAFELTYPPHVIGKATVIETRRITMDLGDHLFKAESRFAVRGDATGIRPLSGLGCGTKVVPIPTAPAKLITVEAQAWDQQPSADVHTVWQSPICTMWEPGENGITENGFNGLALVVPTPGKEFAIHQGMAIAVLGDDLAKPAIRWAGAVWERGLDYHTADAWMKAVQAEAARHAAPLRVESK